MRTSNSYSPLVQPMFDGPLDIVGDIHGGFGALLKLIGQLGYNSEGKHPQGRRLIFLGDLVDRGENSPAVFSFVMDLCSKQLAQCVMGNHELNILISHIRPGAEWYWGGQRRLANNGHSLPNAIASAIQRRQFLDFAKNLPLALERSDLRAVHACWDTASIDFVRGNCRADLLHEEIDRQIFPRKKKSDLKLDRWLMDQNDNPVKVITSGLERPAAAPFTAGGKLRITERSPWWISYRDRQAVVFGHYWHSKSPINRLSKIPSPFPYHHRADTPLGPRQNAWCIDFSNGHRNEEQLRRPWQKGTVSALAALRWPEKEIVSV